MESPVWTDYFVAYGLLQRDGQILLVGNRWRWSERPDLVWTLPGGRAEPGEPIPHALLREFREETGITVEAGPLLFVVEVLLPTPRQRFVSFVFSVTEHGRTAPAPHPEDDAVAEVRFTPVERVTEALSLDTMREPLAAYLAGPTTAARFHSFTVAT